MSDLDMTTLPDLLDSPDPAKRRRRRRHRRFHWARSLTRRLRRYDWRILTLMIVGGLAAVIMAGLVLSMNARTRLDNSYNSLQRVWNSVSQRPGTDLTLADFERLQRAVTDLNGALGSARRQTAILRPVSPLSADLETSLVALDAAQEIGLAASDMLTGLQPTLFFLTKGEEQEKVGTQLSSGERVVELLGLGRGRFLSAQQHLAQAERIIQGIDLGQSSQSLLITMNGLQDYHAQLQDINRMLLDSPNLLTAALGLREAQSYLVLAQNSDELRPSGGYISTWGWMTVRNARINNYYYSASTESSPNPPPLELGSQVAVPSWWIQYRDPVFAAWDSSWSADFPTTAQRAAWYYEQGGNPESPVDGVIGIDIVGFEYLLEGLGSVTVPDYNITVTPATFRQEVYEIRAETAEHKQFVAAIYAQILSGWQGADPDTNATLRGQVLRALQEKHVMIYFADPKLNEAMDVLGWLGNQQTAAGQDYLMVADANMGNKANRSVIRQFTYDVKIQPDGSLASRLAVDYDYSARTAKQDPAVGPKHGSLDYNNILQIYVPAGSELVNAENLPVEPTVVPGDPFTTFVTRGAVKYDESQRYLFSYVTPPLVESFGPYQRYRLSVQKQPGTLHESISVQVTLPPGARVVHTSPEPAASYALEQSILEFRLDLTTDQQIDILYQR